ncbi:MAG: alpha-L-fucosidase, partial [Proteobacteria bacterium]|nr:alpha-L-fucosidase [Pseudomonadota bacterium]
DTWSHAYGKDLYAFVRGLQPRILINNRVDIGRRPDGLTEKGAYRGDFGTPEQAIPQTAETTQPWETCTTIGRHWGYNRRETKRKSVAKLLQILADTSSKGGNLLLNVGPRGDGTLPAADVQRLRAMGRWLRKNGEAIYGTEACPFGSFEWGVCTVKHVAAGNDRLYLHVFDWPRSRSLQLVGLHNTSKRARVLGAPERRVQVSSKPLALSLRLPKRPKATGHSVIAVELDGALDLDKPPEIEAPFASFVDATQFRIGSDRSGVLRYTLDGSDPTPESARFEGTPVRLASGAKVRAQLFRDGRPASPIAERTLSKVKPLPAARRPLPERPGVRVAYYEGQWNALPDFSTERPKQVQIGTRVTIPDRIARRNHFGLEFRSWLRVPKTGMYRFHLSSDDGSRLWIGDKLLVDNDGLHSPRDKAGEVALQAGLHALRVAYFESGGHEVCELFYEGPGIAKRTLPAPDLFVPDDPR